MSIDYISGEVSRVIEKYAETDPIRLCRDMNILLLHEPMGAGENACKGFYFSQSRVRVITVNSDLTPELSRIILAHELGHAVLHSNLAGVHAFHDFRLFDETSVYEYEANIFAADLLIDDEQVLSLLVSDISFFGAAAELNVPPELLDYKFRILKRKGHAVIDAPISARSDFLKKLH